MSTRKANKKVTMSYPGTIGVPFEVLDAIVQGWVHHQIEERMFLKTE